MNIGSIAVAVLLFTMSPAAMAATVACPDLATVVQVGACPSEEELKYTFTGYCSDNSKAYKGQTDVCTDYRLYREFKNTALWESADGEFSAYVSCDLPADTLRKAKATAVKVVRKGKLTTLVCSYGKNLSFSYRTHDECRPATANCGSDPGGCTASCQ
jgi:hypothetical protein